VLAAPRLAAAQEAEPIRDNSFLVEEAYNQERGVVQHVATLMRDPRSTSSAYSFTDEWPLGSLRHQLSVTVPIQHAAAGETGVGDVALNYRYQLLGGGDEALYVAPRASLVLPTGDEHKGFGYGATGLQVNLPVSLAIGERLAAHWNVGATYTPSARDAVGNRADLTSYAVGQSVIWLPHRQFNALVEMMWTRSEAVAGAGATSSSDAFVVVPGVRWAVNFPSGLQIVPGVGVPIGVGPSRGDRAVFGYVSFEHGF